MIRLLLSLLILNSIPTIASSVSSAAADVKTGAAHVAAQGGGSDGKMAVAQYDAEFDTAAPYYTYEPPSAEALKEAYENASKQKNQLDVLVELCKPYANRDPDCFAWEVFERWRKLCEEQGLLEQVASGTELRFNWARNFFEQHKKYNALLNDIGACCLGIAPIIFSRAAMTFDYLRRDHDLIARRLNNFYLQYYFFSRSGFSFEQMHLDCKARSKQYSQEVMKVTPLLAPLAIIVGEYAKWFGYSLTEALQRRPPFGADCSFENVMAGLYNGTYCIYYRMISSLEGDLPAAYKAQSKVSFAYNIISDFRSCHFPPRCRNLSLDHNRLYRLPVDAFVQQVELQELDLQDNFLRCIRKNSMRGLVKLKHLYFRFNNICLIEDGALTQLPCLTDLSLRDNNLHTIPADIEVLTNRGQLTSLSLEGNPLNQNPSECLKLVELMKKIDQNKAKSDASSCSVQ